MTSKWATISAVVLGIALLAGCVGCGSSLGSSSSLTSAASTTRSRSDDYAEYVQRVVLHRLRNGRGKTPISFGEMCTTTVTWACMIASLSSKSPGEIDVNLARQDAWIRKWGGSRDPAVIGEHVARSIYHAARAGGIRSLVQIVVYAPDGSIAYVSKW